MVSALCCFIALLLVSVFQLAASFRGWIDPDTPSNEYQRKSFTDGQVYDLVMSDEFNRDGRTFEDGHDPMWTGIEISDDDQSAAGRKSLQYYNSSKNYLKTEKGNLVITTTTEDTTWKGYNPFAKKYETMKKTFRSGMMQSWNKFCFTGGIMEIDVQFPGHPHIGGLWPAVWLMGNLGRATYLASTNLLWPWSYTPCDRNLQRAQLISGCDIASHFGLNKNQGRGATEIDVIEVMAGQPTWLPFVKENLHRPYNSMTLQTAPGVPSSKNRPQPASLPEWGFTWYKNITYGENTSINPFFYGTYLGPTEPGSPVVRYKSQAFQADAISSMVQLNESHFNSMHTFRLEWQPGKDGGYIHWYMDGKFRFGVEQDGLHGTMGADIPNEPSYLILNTAISTSWGFPNPPPGCKEYDCKTATGQCGMFEGFCTNFPAHFLIDHVRIYQNKNDSRQTLGCNPKEYPTTRWIEGHEYMYKRDIDEHPLKPVMTGGGRCSAKGECGEGNCAGGYCRCKSGWQGPKCLVPTYKNDFPNWELDNWAQYSLPYVPPFLKIGVTIMSLILGAVIVLVIRHRKAGGASSAVVSSAGSVQPSVRGYQQLNQEDH